MSFLKTVITFAIPAVTALFGLLWFFGRKKPPVLKKLKLDIDNNIKDPISRNIKQVKEESSTHSESSSSCDSDNESEMEFYSDACVKRMKDEGPVKLSQLNLVKKIYTDGLASRENDGGPVSLQKPTHSTVPSLESLNSFMNQRYHHDGAGRKHIENIQDMEDANEVLSKRLHEVLDVIGASEYTREQYWEFAMVHEIRYTFEKNLPYSNTFNKREFYQVGSKFEGTTTTDLNSDLDLLHCENQVLVVENLFESAQQGISFLILTDENTKPGYVRFQIVKNKCLYYVGMDDIPDCYFIDKNGRVCAKNLLVGTAPNIFRNGPAHAFTTEFWNCHMDIVYTLRCRQIPSSANSWLHRIRKYGWPSQKQLKEMASYGCFFVGVAHPHSDNKYCEWRVSFSLQERDLMSSLNETQHKCYILLKMIKKDIIEPNVGESISSYHCKTSLFYTIENSQRHFWTYGKLILCVLQCLKRLFIWVKAQNCPNYFIPESNMFEKLSVKTLEKVEHVLNEILKSGIKFLYSITCDNVGELLKSELTGIELAFSLADTSILLHPRLVVCYEITQKIYDFKNILLQRISLDSNTNIGYMHGLMQLLLYLQFTNHITEHTTRDVRMVLDSIIPHIALQYKQCMFVQYLSEGNFSDLQSMAIPNIISETNDFDLISSKLSLASLYVQSEQYQEECRCILVSCEDRIEPFVVSMCCCSYKTGYVKLAHAKKMRLTDMSNKEFRRHCITDCMLFHPSQVSLVHAALQYEMFRNVFTQPGSEIETDWITVDSQVYLYFLQYILYSKTNKLLEQLFALRNLSTVLDTDTLLGHKETGLNLLSWIWLHEQEIQGAGSQETKIQSAWRFLCYSWQIRPFKNAAKWHMLILLLGIIKRE